MKTILSTLSILVVIFTSCSPNNSSTNSSTPAGPTVVNSNVYGGTMYANQTMFHTPANHSYDIDYTYTASFVDANGALINGGSLKANNLVLQMSPINNVYSGSVDGHSVGPIGWIGDGNTSNNIPAFNVLTKWAPDVPFLYPDTFQCSLGYTLTHPKLYADSIEYKIKCPSTNKEVLKVVLDSSNMMLFSVSELTSLNVSSECTLEVHVRAVNQEKKTIGTKYYKFINQCYAIKYTAIKP